MEDRSGEGRVSWVGFRGRGRRERKRLVLCTFGGRVEGGYVQGVCVLGVHVLGVHVLRAHILRVHGLRFQVLDCHLLRQFCALSGLVK
jgi:hypothetical protein